MAAVLKELGLLKYAGVLLLNELVTVDDLVLKIKTQKDLQAIGVRRANCVIGTFCTCLRTVNTSGLSSASPRIRSCLWAPPRSYSVMPNICGYARTCRRLQVY